MAKDDVDGRGFQVDGEILGILAGMLFVFAVFGDLILPPNKQETVPRRGSQQLLREALKNPAALDRLIEQLSKPEVVERVAAQLKDMSLTNELLGDPQITQNLAKLANAIEGRVKGPLEQTIRQLREKKDILDATRPANWAEKAVQGKVDQPLPKQRN